MTYKCKQCNSELTPITYNAYFNKYVCSSPRCPYKTIKFELKDKGKEMKKLGEKEI